MKAPFEDVEDGYNTCIHGTDLNRYDCEACLEIDIDRTCPVCGCGNADKLTGDGYACSDKKCKTVWTVNPDKTKTYYTEFEHRGETLSEMETVK